MQIIINTAAAAVKAVADSISTKVNTLDTRTAKLNTNM